MTPDRPVSTRSVRAGSPEVQTAEQRAGVPELALLTDRVEAARHSVPLALDLALDLGAVVPLPGSGRTADTWHLLGTLAAADLTVARVVEPHLDALAILDQAGRRGGPTEREPLGQGTWGVFAAEQPGLALTASARKDGAWILNGTKPWCSLASQLDHAVVTAHLDDGGRRAFAVDLRAPGVTPEPAGTWISRGLPTVTSSPVRFDGVAATPVGATDWYLTRDGFAWGGIGVAACWYGGARGVARTLLDAARRRTPDQIALMHLGRVDAALHETRTVLADAADAVDAGRASGQAGALLAARVRATAFRCAELVLDAAAHGLGPAPLAFDDRHAARVADLHLYLRQHHAERDDAALGRRISDASTAIGSPW